MTKCRHKKTSVYRTTYEQPSSDNAAANRYNETCDTLINIAHTLQTPLAILHAECELMRRTNASCKNIYRLEKAIQEVSSFVSRLLHIAKLDVFEAIEFEDVMLSGLIKDQIEYFEEIAHVQQVAVTYEIASGITVRGNKNLLRDVCINILSNALRYRKLGRKGKIHVEVYEEQCEVVLCIQDNGKGIRKSCLATLFNCVFRPSRDTSNIRGTGLGLPFCKKVIDIHKGSIDIASAWNIGTTVTVRLPRH